MSDVLKKIGKRLATTSQETMSLGDYLEKSKSDSLMYANTAERLLAAIGNPEMVDTKKNDRLSRVFSNEIIPMYKAFSDIYGIETTIRDLVAFVKHAAQGLEERKQILYLLGPVGSSKSTIVFILKRLFESIPFYAIKGSPVFDNPLSVFSKQDSKELGIPERYFNTIPSPWLVKRLTELNGDISKLEVVKLFPSEARQIAMSHVEPGDPNNQDISVLVGKLNIREIEEFSQSDPDAYSFSGGLCSANRGLLEFAEMFKADIKVLNPLLEATQSGFYTGTESIGLIPFEGMIVAHSNESDWTKFRNNPSNEALIDRICVVRVPYCLRYDEEVKIYNKILGESSLSKSPCAPRTLETLAKFSVISRLVESSHSNVNVKMKIYNGENLKSTNPDAKNVFEYKKEVHSKGIDEGFYGISTRFAFKTLARTFNYDLNEIAANPLHLLLVLDERIKQEHLKKDEEERLLGVIEFLMKEFYSNLDKDIKKAYFGCYKELGQNMFDQYLSCADSWLNGDDYRDPVSNLNMTADQLDSFLEEIETPANISNKKDFRNEVVKYALRFRAQNNGKNPDWTSYNKIRDVLEAKMFANIDDMLPIISSSTQATEDGNKQHREFVARMVKEGYTERQVSILVDWFTRASKE